MESDVLITLASILLAFVMGVGLLFLVGGGLFRKYLMVKASRGLKVLVFAKNRHGWKAFIASREEDRINFKSEGIEYKPMLPESGPGRFYRADAAWIDLTSNKAQCLDDKEQFDKGQFDSKVFNNLFVRAWTRPSPEDLSAKQIKLMMILLLIVLVGVFILFMKVTTLQQAIAGLNQIGGAI